MQEKEILHLSSNTSDHYPIRTQISCGFECKDKQKDVKSICGKPNWKRVDTEKYRDSVEKQLSERSSSGCLNKMDSESKVLVLTHIWKETANSCSQSRQKWTSKPKLKVWNNEISANLRALRESYKIWLAKGKPLDNAPVICSHCTPPPTPTYGDGQGIAGLMCGRVTF